MRRSVIWALGIVVACALAGLLGGWLWMTRWDAPMGSVVSHVWYPDPWDEGNKADFDATAWFALISLGLGIILGFAAAWLSRAGELLTLAALVVGTGLASWVMFRYGIHAAPPSPTAVAKTAADGTSIVGTLHHPGWSARGCFPLGAVVALGGWFLFAPVWRREASEPTEPTEPSAGAPPVQVG